MAITHWPLVLLLVFSGILGWGLAFYAFKRRSIPGVFIFSILCFSVGYWAFLYAIEILTFHVPLISSTAKFEYFGITAIPVLWFLFAIEYTNQNQWLKRWYIPLFFIVPLFCTIMALTNDLHHMFWVNIFIDTSNGIPFVVYNHGLYWWLVVLYSYPFLVAGTAVFFWAIIRYPAIYRKQSVFLILAGLFPWFGNISFAITGGGTLGIDFTPLMFILSELLFAWSIFRFQLLDLVPVARDLIIENMDEGVLVLDPSHRIVDINPAGVRMLGVNKAFAVGSSINIIKKKWNGKINLAESKSPQTTELHSKDSPDIFLGVKATSFANRNGKSVGFLLVLNNISKLKLMERLKDEERTLADAFRDSIAAVTSTLRIDEIFDRILTYAQQVVPHDASSIALIDNDDVVRFPYYKGYIERGLEAYIKRITFPLSKVPHWQEMFRTHEPVIISDTQTDPRWVKISEVKWIRSYLSVPIMIKDRVIGFLNLDSVKKGFFQDDHAERLKSFASQVAVAIENARLFDEINKRAEQLSVVNRIGVKITEGLNLDQLLLTLLEQCQQAIPIDVFYIAFYNETDQKIDIPLFYDVGQYRKGVQRDLREKEGLTGYVIHTRKIVTIPDLQDPQNRPPVEFVMLATEKPVRAYVGVPLIARERVVGVISMQSYNPNAFSLDQIKLLEIIATQATFAIDNARMYSHMEELATTDSLTGLYNRRQFMILAQLEIDRIARYRKRCSLIMIDLDNFKAMNDTFGHGAGDRVLFEFGKLCKNNLRKIDILGRLGGDEYAVLLPETDAKAALLTAERLRSETEKLEVIFGNSLVKFTASFGISVFMGKIKNLQQLMDSADKALYEAKSAGRNTVATAAYR